jgi:tetratricopeptide (TPR) repeat protein
MNIRFTALLFGTLTTLVSAQNTYQAPAQVAAMIVTEEGSQPAWIVEASKNAIRYRESEVASDTIVAKLTDLKHIYLYEPREFTAAMELYQARKYEEAKAAFAAVKERYQPLAALENSPAILAAFYEMECLRKLGDLDGLEKALQKFDKRMLTNENQLRQVDLYVMWRVLHSKNWQSVENIAKERAKTRLPGDQRAQVSYCHGRALEELGRPAEAIVAYQTALVADYGASEEITRKAAQRILTVLKNDPDVQRAIRDWEKPEENKNSPGYTKLLEASAVAALYELTLGGGSPLPDDLKDLTKYRPKPKKKAVE